MITAAAPGRAQSSAGEKVFAIPILKALIPAGKAEKAVMISRKIRLETAMSRFRESCGRICRKSDFRIRQYTAPQDSDTISTGRLHLPPLSDKRKHVHALTGFSCKRNVTAETISMIAGITASARLDQKSRTGSTANRNASISIFLYPKRL